MQAKNKLNFLTAMAITNSLVSAQDRYMDEMLYKSEPHQPARPTQLTKKQSKSRSKSKTAKKSRKINRKK